MSVVEWLLDSDPAIRWQAIRDLTDATGEEVAFERARVAGEGWVRGCSTFSALTATGTRALRTSLPAPGRAGGNRFHHTARARSSPNGRRLRGA